MFTVKIADDNGGYTAHQCDAYSVTYDNCEVNSADRVPYVSWWREGDPVDVPALPIKHACYVENEAGKTVDVIRREILPRCL